MKEQTLRVIGSYETQTEAMTVIEHLRDAGYRKENILLYTNQETADKIDKWIEVQIETGMDTTEEKTLWDKIKDAFSFDTYDYEKVVQEEDYFQDRDPLYLYKEDIADGRLVVVVSESPNLMKPNESPLDPPIPPDPGEIEPSDHLGIKDPFDNPYYPLNDPNHLSGL